MAASPTHVVVGTGCVSRSGADAGAGEGRMLEEGQHVAVLGYAEDGWAQAEVADGTQVWVAPDALSPIAPSVAAAPAAAASAVSAVAAAWAAETGVLTVSTEQHPPPPAPGAELPVRVAGLRLTTQLFAGALIVAAALLPWTSQQYSTASTAFGVPLRSLVDGVHDPDGAVTAGFVKLAFLIVPLGVVVLIAGLRILPPVVGQAAGGVAALVALLFVLQLQRAMGKFYAATVFGVLGIGVYVTLLGGIVAAMSRGAEARS